MDERPVQPKQIHELLATATRIVVTESPLPGAQVLFESSRRTDASQLLAALTVATPENYFHCMCIGAPAIYAYAGDTLLFELTNHHGTSVRCSLWDSDAPVIDPEAWLHWFDRRGIAGPRAEVEEAKAREEQHKRDLNEWLAGMPPVLRPVWSREWVGPWDCDVPELSHTLQQGVHDEGERIRALLEWFGSGAGPWSGYPAYEMIAEQLLLEFSGETVVETAGAHRLSVRQTEGLARLFESWRQDKARHSDLDLVPASLKRRVTRHVAAGHDPDKIARLRRALVREG